MRGTFTRFASAILALVLVLAAARPLRAESLALDASQPPSVRTTDRRMRALFDEGLRRSLTFRAVVDRLNQSDVVVYLHCEAQWSPRVAGRLTFVAATGGLRYVVVRIARQLSREQQLAILGHELQHAVEIADTPAIVDAASLEREYRRFGYVSRWSPTPGVAFDSQAAVDTGVQVLREVTAAAAD